MGEETELVSLEWKIEKYHSVKGGFKLSNKYRTFITALKPHSLIEIKDEIERVLKEVK